MARPIPDDRVEEERRKMKAHEDEFYGNSLLSPFMNRPKRAIGGLVTLIVIAIYLMAFVVYRISR
jgi:hypothetical protein